MIGFPPYDSNKSTNEVGSNVRSTSNSLENVVKEVATSVQIGKRKFEEEEGRNEALKKDLCHKAKIFEVILIESSDEEEDPEEEPQEDTDPGRIIWLDDISKDDDEIDEITIAESGHSWKVASPGSYVMARRAFPVKQDDPGAFFIRLSIGPITYEKCLIDSGASENMLPYDLYDPSRLPPLQPVEYGMELADQSTVYPLGMCEDVIVDLVGHPLQMNFIVMDMHPPANGGQSEIILGRTFMATMRATMDFGTGVLIMQLPSKTLFFNKNGTLLQSRDDITPTLQPVPLSYWRSSENETGTSRKAKK